MSWIKDEIDKEFTAVGFKNQRRLVRKLPQVGTTNKMIDASRKALASGKRISKNGNVYWETRKNRSDSKGTNI